jgi:hypothetical protein
MREVASGAPLPRLAADQNIGNRTAATVARSKQGFAMPVAQWLTGKLKELVSDLLSAEGIRRQGLFDTACSAPGSPGVETRQSQAAVDAARVPAVTRALP